MSRRKDMALIAAGLLAGMALAGPAGAAVQQLTATPSTQPIYVDGKQVSMTAYGIEGSNYVMLRDVGRAVGFNVYWDDEHSAVQIETDRPYTGLPPADSSVNFSEESVQAALWSLMDAYPTGTTYETPYRSTSNGPYSSGRACAGWAVLCSDAVFGDLPWRRVVSPGWEEIRPGDLLRYDNDSGGHVVVVLEKTDDYVMVTESGPNNKARWGGQYFRWWLEEQPGYTCYTRYPA